MSKGGRPRALDDVKRGQICALITAGCNIEAAARYVSCSVSTIRREALRNTEFRQNLRGAEVQSQIGPLQAMQAAATTHWRAAAWLLERTNPQQFAPPRAAMCKPQELQAMVDAIVEKAVEEIADPQTRDRVCRQLLATAYRASRLLAADPRRRLDPDTKLFEPNLSRDDQDIQQLMSQVDRDSRIAASSLSEGQNRRRIA